MRHASTITVALLAGLAPIAIAQDQPGSAEKVEAARSILPRVGTIETPVMPTVAALSLAYQPGLGEGPDWLEVLNETLETKLTPSTLAEGSFINARLGDILIAPGGQVIFSPDKQERKAGEGAVILLPSHTLERLQEEWSGQRVLLSGEVLTYHQRNMLLISDYRLVRDAAPKPEPTKPAADPETESEPSGVESDPEVMDLLRELDNSETESTRPGSNINRFETEPRTPQQRDPQALTSGPAEGTLILRRPARLVRNEDGAWTLAFDNDSIADDSSDQLSDLIVLPCRALMRMERWAMDQGDAARFVVSGRVYTYKGDSYLLPTIAQRLGASDINSIQ